MRKTERPRLPPSGEPASTRMRIVYAAFAAFLERGFSNVSMLDIATRAKVSKRDLYAEFASKMELLEYCISIRAKNVNIPENLSGEIDRESLATALSDFAIAMLDEIVIPEVLAAYRLAIAEIWSAPQIAQTLNRLGRQAAHKTLTNLITQAQSEGLLEKADPAELADRFFTLTTSDLTLQLLLGAEKRPTKNALQRKAKAGVAAFLALHSA